MAEKYAGFVVTFEHGLGEEYMAQVQEALKLYHGVISVEPVRDGVDMHIAREQVRRELGSKLMEVLYPTKR